jgi:hypothetical protein
MKEVGWKRREWKKEEVGVDGVGLEEVRDIGRGGTDEKGDE